MLATGELDSYDCSRCSDDQKLLRRCPYPGQDADRLARGRAAHPPDPGCDHACPLLKVRWWHHRILRDAPDYERGHLLTTGSLSQQPAWWVWGCREALRQVQLSQERLRQARQPRSMR